MKQIIAGSEGFVGKAVKELFPDAVGYDIKHDHVKYLNIYPEYPPNKLVDNYFPAEHYDFCHICTPTPMKEDGSCDTSSVEDVISKIDADVYIIRSTVSPGTTKKHKNAVMQPEFVASDSPYPAPFSDIRKHPFIILGGESNAVKKVRKLYETVYPPTIKFIEMTGLEAEIAKYMENSFIATYVTFCNEYYDICKQYGADWHKVREGFLSDPRMTSWWTNIYEDKRGWGGRCLPKDLSSIVHETNSEFLNDVIKNNRRHRNERHKSN